MIELQGVEKSYTSGDVVTRVLNNISFRVERGEFVAVMGTSGSGKSTLMNIIGCLDRPTGGRYVLEGSEVADLDDDALSQVRNAKIGFIFQQFHLLERTTALKNTMLPLIYCGRYPSDAHARAEKALTAVGLSERIRYKPNQLSGGEQQRVAIARALINDPHLILADEPTGNLDRKNGLDVLAIFQRLHSEGRTIVMVTHDEKIAEHAARIVHLGNGTITNDHAVEMPRNAEEELRDISKENAS